MVAGMQLIVEHRAGGKEAERKDHDGTPHRQQPAKKFNPRGKACADHVMLYHPQNTQVVKVPRNPKLDVFHRLTIFSG